MTPGMQPVMVLLHGKLVSYGGAAAEGTMFGTLAVLSTYKRHSGPASEQECGAAGQQTGMWVQGRVACYRSILAAGRRHAALLV